MPLLPKLIAGALLALFSLPVHAAPPATAASIAAQEEPPAATAAKELSVEDAVNALRERGVIKQSAYWLANARKGKTCKGEDVAALILNLEKLTKP